MKLQSQGSRNSEKGKEPQEVVSWGCGRNGDGVCLKARAFDAHCFLMAGFDVVLL